MRKLYQFRTDTETTTIVATLLLLFLKLPLYKIITVDFPTYFFNSMNNNHVGKLLIVSIISYDLSKIIYFTCFYKTWKVCGNMCIFLNILLKVHCAVKLCCIRNKKTRIRTNNNNSSTRQRRTDMQIIFSIFKHFFFMNL